MIGFTYHDHDGKQITVLRYDNLFPGKTRFLVKREDGVVWSVKAERITILVKQSEGRRGAKQSVVVVENTVSRLMLTPT